MVLWRALANTDVWHHRRPAKSLINSRAIFLTVVWTLGIQQSHIITKPQGNNQLEEMVLGK